MVWGVMDWINLAQDRNRFFLKLNDISSPNYVNNQS